MADGFGLSQLFLLPGLRQTGQVPVTRWVEMIGGAPSATTGLLDRLESKGYVEWAHGTDDRPQVPISFTPKRRRLANRLSVASRGRWRGLCVGVPPAELEAASMTLEQIVARLDQSGFDVAPTTTHNARRRKAS